MERFSFCLRKIYQRKDGTGNRYHTKDDINVVRIDVVKKGYNYDERTKPIK